MKSPAPPVSMPSGSTKAAACVLGMHRSGTSMFAGLLHHCGFSLGPRRQLLHSDDNPVGYHENRQFVAINDQILATFGGSWDNPPVLQNGWHYDRRLAQLGRNADRLISSFKGEDLWLWKDPRTCLTLPFWLERVPDAALLVCLRHPMEVGQSFAARKNDQRSREEGIRLWQAYHDALLPVLAHRPHLVSHYVSHFYDAGEELQRVFEFLEMEPPRGIQEAKRTIKRDLWHGFGFDLKNDYFALPQETQRTYDELCERAGPVFRAQLNDEEFQLHLREQALGKALSRITALEDLYTERSRQYEEMARALREVQNANLVRRVGRWAKRALFS